MSRRDGFTLLEILLAIVIGLLLMSVAVPSVTGLLRDQSLKKTYEQFDDFVRTAQMRAVSEGRTLVMVWDEGGITLVPLDPDSKEEDAKTEAFSIPDGCTFTLERPAALVKKPVAEWPFWRSGTCEPVIVHCESKAGTWTVEYNGLTVRGRVLAMESK
jgi:prepilin-type N-terminal cleavage/methylation domain-containing protein